MRGTHMSATLLCTCAVGRRRGVQMMDITLSTAEEHPPHTSSQPRRGRWCGGRRGWRRRAPRPPRTCGSHGAHRSKDAGWLRQRLVRVEDCSVGRGAVRTFSAQSCCWRGGGGGGGRPAALHTWVFHQFWWLLCRLAGKPSPRCLQAPGGGLGQPARSPTVRHRCRGCGLRLYTISEINLPADAQKA